VKALVVDFKVRVAKNFNQLLAEIKLEFIKAGKVPPSNRVLTDRIAKKLKKEDILYDGFIPFR